MTVEMDWLSCNCYGVFSMPCAMNPWLTVVSRKILIDSVNDHLVPVLSKLNSAKEMFECLQLFMNSTTLAEL